MTTTIYQKFIGRYAETFTLVEMIEGCDYSNCEIIPAAKVANLNEEEYEELFSELRRDENEKASWSDGEEEFDEEDARAEAHLKWDEIEDSMDKIFG